MATNNSQVKADIALLQGYLDQLLPKWKKAKRDVVMEEVSMMWRHPNEGKEMTYTTRGGKTVTTIFHAARSYDPIFHAKVVGVEQALNRAIVVTKYRMNQLEGLAVATAS